MSPIPDDIKEDVLLACRYGETEDVQAFVKEYGDGSLEKISDENGNSILHMVSANGHAELLNFLLPLVPSLLIEAQNVAGSTALHWAALNKQLEVARQLVLHPNSPGRRLIDIKNKTGRSPLGEAEEAGWEEGAKMFVEIMDLDKEEVQGQSVEEDGELDENTKQTVEVESGIAQISLSDSGEGYRDKSATNSGP